MSAHQATKHRPTVALETHGCKLNQADTEVLASEFARAGFSIVPPGKPVDVYVVNTCTVTHIADRKARHALRAARRRHPDAVLVAAGCYSHRDPEILQNLAAVDLVIGNVDKRDLVARVVAFKERLSITPAAYTGVGLPPRQTARARAMVKIQEGCDQVCAYCIVPKVRGRERSLPTDGIVSHINELTLCGVKEAVLTGTEPGSYGSGRRDATLRDLIRRILEETRIMRLRVSSLQPREIVTGILDLWSDPRLCPHFHVPLQSGSDEVLRLMRRQYTTTEYADAIRSIQQTVPNAAITTDVMVGFPGEGEPHFQDTLNMCREMGFASVHVFPYSARPGTSATRLANAADADTKADKVERMLVLSKRLSGEFRDQSLGSTRPVLWHGPMPAVGPRMWAGLTDNYIKVACESTTSLVNEITLARLVRQERGFVIAEPLQDPKHGPP